VNTTRLKRAKIGNCHGCSQSGGAVLGVLLLVGVATIMIGGVLNLIASTTKSVKAAKVRTDHYYDAERSFHLAASWVRDNSGGFVYPFTRENFYDAFDRTAPTVGSNDTSYFTVPTLVKINGTSESAILITDPLLATEEFPVTMYLSGGSFEPMTEFNSSVVSNSIVRITLVDVLPEKPARDFGDPDLGNPAPETDFYPVFRIDAMTDLFEGAHVYGYVVGSLVYNTSIGFYGEDSVELQMDCDSYKSDDGPYGPTNMNAGCTLGSNVSIGVKSNSTVYGAAQSNGVIETTNPWGGPVCDDFDSGCPVPGYTCEGPGCNVPLLPTFDSWSTLCPTNQGNLTVNANTYTLVVTGGSPAESCWATVKVRKKKTLVLTTTAFPYYFDTLDIANNADVQIQPDTPGGTVTVFLRKFDRDKFDGGQLINTAKPYQFKLNYLGTDDLTIAASEEVFVSLMAPYVEVSAGGGFDIFGLIHAKSFSPGGSGVLHYDESSSDDATLTDSKFTVRNVVQRYR